MIDIFKEYLIGQFDNKFQALSNPSRYARIIVTHVQINDSLIYGEQAYSHSLKAPYRQFVLKPIKDDGKIKVINYQIKDEHLYRGCENIESINEESLIKRIGCSTIFQYKDEKFYGEIEGCECYVNWRNAKTYLINKIELGKDYYFVLDKGISVETKAQIWGSQYGEFKFYKVPQ